jgi:ATP-dependent Lon protease
MKLKTIRGLNIKLNSIHTNLISVSNNIQCNYMANVITVDQYQKYMSMADSLIKQLQTYEQVKLCNVSKETHKIHYLHYKLYKLIQCCGATTCYDILNFYNENWKSHITDTILLSRLEILNTLFTPVMVKIIPFGSAEAMCFSVSKYNSFTLSIILKLHGAELTIPVGRILIIIKGYFREDPLNIARLKIKKPDLDGAILHISEDWNIGQEIIEGYIKQLSLRDYVSMDTPAIIHMMTSDFKDLHFMRSHSPVNVAEAFLKAGIKKRASMLTLLLLDKQMNHYIYSIPKQNVNGILHWSVKQLYDQLINININININPNINININELPYEVRIDRLNAPEVVKRKAREKLKEIKGSRDNSEKAVKYLDGLLSIPFGIYRKEQILSFVSDFSKKITASDLPLTSPLTLTPIMSESDINTYLHGLNVNLNVNLLREWNAFKTERKIYLDYVQDTLEECIYGQEIAKRSIQAVIAHWINGDMSGMVFGFQGYPGTGKTSLAKHGIAQCIRDNNGNSRPFFFISLGGSKGGSSLLGHSYTYVGSQCGKIAECLQSGNIMNPILYFDELDKVSDSSCGEEIIRILTHLTDPEQNDHIEDRYFGVDLDLSKALIIFSYNNRSRIDSVLMDRIHEIRFNAYMRGDKMQIARKYMLPKILKSLGFLNKDNSQSIIFTDSILKYIIETYTIEAGVRDMKAKLTHIVREINLRRIYDETKYTIPFTVTMDLVDEILTSCNKIRRQSIATHPQIGLVNGLYATDIGTGGLTVIQVSGGAPSEQKYHIELTGKLGDVMKESVKCAKTISWAMLPEKDRVWGDNALHIHFPSAGTSKDGPSAGAAITLAIISYFSKLPVRHDIAITGEIDLHGNILPVGGLQCKLEGADNAKIKYMFIPRGNEQEFQDFSFNMDVNMLLSIKVIPVDHISEVIRACLIGVDTKDFTYLHPEPASLI